MSLPHIILPYHLRSYVPLLIFNYQMSFTGRCLKIRWRGNNHCWTCYWLNYIPSWKALLSKYQICTHLCWIQCLLTLGFRSSMEQLSPAIVFKVWVPSSPTTSINKRLNICLNNWLKSELETLVLTHITRLWPVVKIIFIDFN